MILSTLVLSQLDYVNSILSMAPITTIKPYHKFRTQQPERPTKSQKEMMLTCAYVNYIGCPLNTDPHSNSLQLHTTLFMEKPHNTLRRNYNERNFLG